MTSETSNTEGSQLYDDDEEDYELLKIEDPNVLAYIKNLKSLISRQRTLIFTLRNKLENVQKPEMIDVSIQTDQNMDCVEKISKYEDNNSSETANWSTVGNDVTEMVKEAAEVAMGRTGFVFEKSSGMYYDYNTGYYYDAERGLYYDGNSGTYYSYNKEKNEFEFYSQIYSESQKEIEGNTETSSQRKRRGKLEKDESKRKKVLTSSQIEEGECSDASSSVDSKSSDNEDTNEINNYNFNDNLQTIKEVSNPWPPCMRIIVKESSLKGMTVGTLFIVTYTGGTLGREGDDHAVLIPDINISKYHAKIVFNEEDAANKKGHYTLTDLGSRNGTYLNGTRLSTALQESEAHAISHESTIRVGGITLLCHIHVGWETCNECEPGIILGETNDVKYKAYTAVEKTEKHKEELKKLKKKFGIGLKVEGGEKKTRKYEDRAEIRRKTVGSDCDAFKTETASVFQPIAIKNKGFKMLSKMGWSSGETLGKSSSSGITEPVLVEQRPDKVGLGFDKPVVENTITPRERRKQEVWNKARARFKEKADQETQE